MIKKIIFHIGHAKTATTSIQETFLFNAHILNDYGYYYPVWDGHKNHNKLFIILFKQDLLKYERLVLIHEINLSRIEKIRSKAKKWLTRQLLNCKASTVIFSGESFPNFNESEIDTIKTFFNQVLGDVAFEIHGYTRDPVSFANSAYQQKVRRQLSDDKVICFPYKEKITPYINVFGRERIKLYKFEDACKYHRGPVHFLLNKTGIEDKIVDQVQIKRKNDSLSEAAVDLFLYINGDLPLDEDNIKSGIRNKRDYKHIKFLPGRKFQLTGKDPSLLQDRSRDDMIWLKNTFNIHYTLQENAIEKVSLDFDDSYVEKMIIVLRKSNPIIRKLIYDYIKRKISEANLDESSLHHLSKLESHIKQKYPFTVNLSYTQLAYRQRAFWMIHGLLRQSKTLRWVKYHWIDQPGSIG